MKYVEYRSFAHVSFFSYTNAQTIHIHTFQYLLLCSYCFQARQKIYNRMITQVPALSQTWSQKKVDIQTCIKPYSRLSSNKIWKKMDHICPNVRPIMNSYSIKSPQKQGSLPEVLIKEDTLNVRFSWPKNLNVKLNFSCINWKLCEISCVKVFAFLQPCSLESRS